MIIWLKVTMDKYELPIAVADTVEELAKLCNTSVNNIYSTISHHKRGRQKKTCYRKVVINEN